MHTSSLSGIWRTMGGASHNGHGDIQDMVYKKKMTKSHFYFLAGQLCFFISIKF